MHPMGIIEPEHSAVVPIKQVGQYECEVVANDFLIVIDRDFFPENAYTPGAPKSGFVVGVLARAFLAAHEYILMQVMPQLQHLKALGVLNNIGPASAGPMFVPCMPHS
jgi:hypothetical protein